MATAEIPTVATTTTPSSPPPSSPPPSSPTPKREPLWRHVLGEYLRGARRERGETLDDVAGRAGLSPQYLSEIERGLKEPSSEMIAAVSGALSLTLGDLTLAVAERLTTQQHQTIPVLRVASAQRTCVPQSTVTLAA